MIRFRNKTRYQPGDTLKLLRYIPPILCGTAVTIKDTKGQGSKLRYLVTSSEYSSVGKWVREDELGQMEGYPE